ncbi:hypothetical protein [Pseudolysinimonas sp.]|uniref:hypothetical protein n=1 Tax=Pseudolysinimonas sp. TaxID=2680009 RepID=UPI003F7D49AF
MARVHDIADFRLGLPDEWYPMSIEDDAWATGLAAELTDDPEARLRLTGELESARRAFAAMNDPLVRAAVWVGEPDTGHADAAMVFAMADVEEAGEPGEYERFLASYAGTTVSEDFYYSVSTWRSAVPAGEVVGSHNLIAHPGADAAEGSLLEERTVIAVYPPGSAQAVQFVFSAQGLGSFENMPEQTQAIAAGLSVALEG